MPGLWLPHAKEGQAAHDGFKFDSAFIRDLES